MSVLTDPKSAPSPQMARPMAAVNAENLPQRLDNLERRLEEFVSRHLADTPQAQLDMLSAQISATRATLAENLQWLQVSVRVMTKARELLGDLGLDDAPAVDGLPTAASVSAALTPAAGNEAPEAALAKLLQGFGIKL